jgi:hypothetical protein
MRRLALVLLLGLAACQEGGGDGLEPVGEGAVEAARADCGRRGGTFAAGGRSAALVCFTTPRDAGKQCRKSTDCDSACLARSMTCAPLKPLFGCQEILGAGGERLTQCVD